MRVVAPTAGALIIALLLCLGLSSEQLRDQTAVLIGFAAIYYILLRGGHIIMIRSLHNDLMAKHEAAYRRLLSDLTPDKIRPNISFTLTRIKRKILDSQS